MSVVFAAGFLVPQQIAHQDYFRGIANAFPGAIFPNVPVAGTVVVRGNALAGQINALCPPGPIHIVAHSMAGLDSRFPFPVKSKPTRALRPHREPVDDCDAKFG